MNDFEQKLARQTFREPPADLRRTILAAVATPRASWRDWLWPSPQAWVALAALWLVFAAVQLAERPAFGTASMAKQGAPEDFSPPNFLTFYNSRDLRDVLEFAN